MIFQNYIQYYLTKSSKELNSFVSSEKDTLEDFYQ